MTYEYQGTRREPPTVIRTQPKGRRRVALCGTRGGYARHRRNGEYACPECKAVQAADARARRDIKRGGPKPPVAGCGTIGGYDQHQQRGEYACDECKDARAKYEAARKGHQHTGKRRRTLAPCGTKTAALRHRRRGEPLDYQCRLAEAEEARNRYQPRKAS